MKKILLFIGLLGIVSCTTIDEGKFSESHRTRVRTNQYGYTLDIFKFKFEGHTYIGIDGTSRMNGVIHDPECLKCKENESAY